MSEEILDPEEQIAARKPMTVDDAYLGAGEMTFAGKKLEGWSGRRRAATFEIGFSGAGSVVDPVRVLWTCWVSPEAIRQVFMSPTAATDSFLKWAEDNDCLDPSGDNWQEAFDIAQKIVKQVEKSQFESGEAAPAGNVLGNATGHQNSPAMNSQ